MRCNGVYVVESEFHEGSEEEPLHSREGLFDAQFFFSAPGVDAPQPIKIVVTREGNDVPYDKRKIVQSISRAAEDSGGLDADRADSLAAGVSIYLSKSIRNGAPRVDEIADAVERVLIEMGHVDTALAYARQREREARLRKLRDEGRQAVLTELAAAQASDTTVASVPLDESVSVRTSADTVVRWDRSAIVNALRRETGMDEGMAKVIAFEVEQQIQAARVKTLTAALVRELVDAKLLEYGQEEFRRRHMRLGVPLYDAERIICGPRRNDSTGPDTPETTDRMLAERVKKEYALSHVYSQELANAHGCADLHLHDLAQTDRWHSVTLSPVWVARFGMGLTEGDRFSQAPRGLPRFIEHLVGFTAALQRHASGPIRWDALNYVVAPYLNGARERIVRDAAKMLMYGFSLRALTDPAFRHAPAVILSWDVPARLAQVEALGPGGGGTGKTYGEYAHAAQQFAWALLEIAKGLDLDRGHYPAPTLSLEFTDNLFSRPDDHRVLDNVADAAVACGGFDILLQRGAFEQINLDDPWTARDSVANRITLNLPRIAMEGGNTDRFFEKLTERLDVVALGHKQKRDFLKRLLDARELGPLGLLAAQREGASLVSLGDARFVVGIAGLNECVRHLTGTELHEGDERTMALGERIVETIDARCADLSEAHGVNLSPAPIDDTVALRRFASADLDRYAAARTLLRLEDPAEEIQYTGGATLRSGCGCSAVEQGRLEGRFHPHLSGDTCLKVTLSPDDMSKGSVVAFLKKIYYQTSVRRLRFKLG